VPTLAIYNDKTLEREVELTGTRMRIGRGEQNEIILPDPTKEISRFHAELRFEDGAYVLVDLDSQNGIWLKGQRQTRIPLEPGVAASLGPYTLSLQAVPMMPGETLRPAPAFAETIIQPPLGVADNNTTRPRPASTNPGVTKRAAQKKSRAMMYAMLGVAAVALLIVTVVVVRSNRAEPVTPETPPGETGGPPQGPPPPPPPPGPSEEVAKYIAEARAMAERNEVDGAIGTLDKAIALDATNTEANELRATLVAQKDAALKNVDKPTTTTVATGGEGGKPSVVSPGPGRGTSAPTNCRPGERPADCAAREKELATRYDAAKLALDGQSWTLAIAGFSAIVQDTPSYKDAAVLLTRARDGARAQVQAALEAAAKAESAGELDTAEQQYLRAAQLDSSQTTLVDLSLARVRAVMKTSGTDAFRRARQNDALGRTSEALAGYEQAFRYLPDDDPNKKTAKDRLDILRTRK
jgi:tetratricopeptide (TPR) repeat protein